MRIEYQVHETSSAFGEHMSRACVAPDVDFVDAIIHARDRFVLCVGRFVEQAPYTRSYTGTDIYYRSTLTRREDYLTTYDYFFRYDTDCHWSTRVLPGMDNKLGRALFGKLLLGSTNLLRWSHRLRPILKHRRRKRVVDDLLIPKRRFAEFYAWYEREVGYFPLWIVPYRMPEPYPWIADAHHARASDDVYVDFAVYGLPNDRPNIDYAKLLEAKTYELGGLKALISENHYDPATFWSIYNRERYECVKRRTDPQHLFRGLYEKLHFDNGPEARPALI